MARIGLDILVTGYTGKLLIVWRETVAGNPTPPETGRSAALDFPYSSVYSIDNINPVVHLVELWRSNDGVALDELIKRWNIDASLYNSIKYAEYQYKVDRGWDNTSPVNTGTEVWADPADTDTELEDERLDGATKEELSVHKAGYGDLLREEYELRSGGGITLNLDGTFDHDQAWMIKHYTVQQASATVVTAAQYADVVVLEDDTDFYTDAGDNLYNKLVIVNSANPTVQVSFQDLALIPNNTHVTFQTHGGDQNYLILQFDAGDTVKHMNQAKNVIYLARCQKIKLFFKNGVCYVDDYDNNGLIRGHVFASMDNTIHTDLACFLFADESTGELEADDYPGMYEFIQNLPVGHSVALGTGSGQWGQSVTVNTGKIDEAVTYPNKCKFGIDTIARTFRVPHLKNLARRFVDTGQNPGRYQHDAVGKFEAIPTVPDAYAHTGAPHEAQFTGGNNNNNMQAKGNSKFETGHTETVMKNFGETPFIIL